MHTFVKIIRNEGQTPRAKLADVGPHFTGGELDGQILPRHERGLHEPGRLPPEHGATIVWFSLGSRAAPNLRARRSWMR